MSCNTSPNSCDTFVVVNGTEDGGVIFGKNSDRPEEEVQVADIYIYLKAPIVTKTTDSG